MSALVVDGSTIEARYSGRRIRPPYSACAQWARSRAVDAIADEDRVVLRLLAITAGDDDLEVAPPLGGGGVEGARDHLRRLVRLALEVRGAKGELLGAPARGLDRRALLLGVVSRPLEEHLHDARGPAS